MTLALAMDLGMARSKLETDPALRVVGAYPEWTLEFDDGEDATPPEPDFNDLVILAQNYNQSVFLPYEGDATGDNFADTFRVQDLSRGGRIGHEMRGASVRPALLRDLAIALVGFQLAAAPDPHRPSPEADPRAPVPGRAADAEASAASDFRGSGTRRTAA